MGSLGRAWGSMRPTMRTADSEPIARFGLGRAPQANVVEMHWPSGLVQTLRHMKANQRLQVTEAVQG